MMMSAYITATARFLPGNPVPNEEMEDYLGIAGGTTSDLRDLTLENCGIKTRYYAIDKNQQTIISNAAMAANAVREAAERAGLGPNDVELLTAATTGPDMLAPGHASMVHGELGYGPMEISTSAGIWRPFTNVPLALPRSLIATRLSRMTIWQCRPHKLPKRR